MILLGSVHIFTPIKREVVLSAVGRPLSSTIKENEQQSKD